MSGVDQPPKSLNDLIGGKKRRLCSDSDAAMMGGAAVSLIGGAFGDADAVAHDEGDSGVGDGDGKKNGDKKAKGTRRVRKSGIEKEEPETKKCKRLYCYGCCCYCFTCVVIVLVVFHVVHS